MPDLLKKLFFGDVETKKPGKSSPSVRVRHRNRSGVVDLVGREPLMFARVENGVPKLSPKKMARFCHAVLDIREHQRLPPNLFDHARSIAMPDPNIR